MTSIAVTCSLGFLVTLILLVAFRPAAFRIGLVDRRDGGDPGSDGVPLVGGVAMFCGFMLAALTLDQSLTPYRSFFAACGILVVVGLLDDMQELTSTVRFIAQMFAAALMIWWGGVVLNDLGGLRAGQGLVALGIWSAPLTIFATVGVINALNMIDGLDGLAGGMGLIALLGLVFISQTAGVEGARDVLLLLCACLAAFLILNLRLPRRSRAVVFMGDAGSMFLGFAITWFLVDLSQGPLRILTPVTALWLLLIPLFDTVWLLIKRPLTGRLPTAGDSEHIHHLLQMSGLSPRQVLIALLGIAAAAALLGIGMMRLGVPQNYMFWLFLGLFAVYCLVMATAWKRKRLFGRTLDRRLSQTDRRSAKSRRTEDRRRGGDRRTRPDRRLPPDVEHSTSEDRSTDPD